MYRNMCAYWYIIREIDESNVALAAQEGHTFVLLYLLKKDRAAIHCKDILVRGSVVINSNNLCRIELRYLLHVRKVMSLASSYCFVLVQVLMMLILMAITVCIWQLEVGPKSLLTYCCR